MKSEEDIDKLFKKSMEDPANHRAFNEDDWDALEQMLDAGKKRRGIVYWLPVASGIAAMLLLALGWWFFIKPVKVVDNGSTQAGVKPVITKPGTNSGTTGAAADRQPKDSVLPDQNLAAVSKKDTIWSKQPVNHNLSAVKSPKDTVWNTAAGGNNFAAGQSKRKHPASAQKLSAPFVGGAGNNRTGGDNLAMNRRDSVTLSNAVRMTGVGPARGSVEDMLANQVYSLHVQQAQPAPDLNTQIVPPVLPSSSNTDKPAKKLTKQGFGYRPQWAITALASSDVNGTSTFQGKVGSNYGALLSLGVTKKLTITSGVVYSSKPYATSFANYNTSYVFKNPPTDVLADCKMLDIPINIGYQVYGNFRNKVSVGTGFSSYIMLHEKYTYTYSGYNNPAWPQSYTVPNSKGYYLSILNLNATYERKINSKFGVSVQPYMKVPLSGVGYSDLKLQSTGVAVGVTYNINAFRKP